MSSLVRGRCPDLFTPMQTGDGWLVRIKPRLARLAASQARRIAAQAAECGSGIIELTGRGNLQIRGLTSQSAERFARFAVQDGLASADPTLERIRNIQLAPLADNAACDLAGALEGQLGLHPGLAALPGKFGFLIDPGKPSAFSGQHADITLRAEGEGWRVGLGVRSGRTALPAAEAASAACRLALQWLEAPDRARGHPHRAPTGDAAQSIGWHAGLRAFGIGLSFGQMDAETLETLAGLSLQHGDGMLHCTPWRVLMLSGVSAASAPALAEVGREMITTPGDPRCGVSACIGSRGCASGTVDARGDALGLLEAGIRVDGLHVSGCAKGCAHPGPSPITLVGRDGRYGLVRDGRAGDTPLTGGLSVSQLARCIAGSADGS